MKYQKSHNPASDTETYQVSQPLKGCDTDTYVLEPRTLPFDTYVLELRALPGWHTSGTQRLRGLLKVALRGFGLRCTRINLTTKTETNESRNTATDRS